MNPKMSYDFLKTILTLRAIFVAFWPSGISESSAKTEDAEMESKKGFRLQAKLISQKNAAVSSRNCKVRSRRRQNHFKTIFKTNFVPKKAVK